MLLNSYLRVSTNYKILHMWRQTNVCTNSAYIIWLKNHCNFRNNVLYFKICINTICVRDKKITIQFVLYLRYSCPWKTCWATRSSLEYCGCSTIALPIYLFRRICENLADNMGVSIDTFTVWRSGAKLTFISSLLLGLFGLMTSSLTRGLAR